MRRERILELLSLEFEQFSYCDEVTPDLHFEISISWLKVAGVISLVS